MGNRMRDKRLLQLNAWLLRLFGVAAQDLRPASSDASFRRYFRFDHAGTSYIAMDAPPQQENCRPFVDIGKALLSRGVHVPKVLASDLDQGFLLLTDLGPQTYLQVVNERNAEQLYRQAIKTLVRMQQGGSRQDGILPQYDAELLNTEMQLFVDWLLEQHLLIRLDPRQTREWNACRQWLVEQVLSQPRTWVHRDYHSRNLMVCAENNPGVLDFQDALEGPLTYDLVSLLKDCYIRWPQPRVLEWLAYYRQHAIAAGMPVPGAAQLLDWFEVMGVQRHLKAAGIFARLHRRDQKPGYLKDIPRVLSYLQETARNYPPLHFLGELCTQALVKLP